MLFLKYICMDFMRNFIQVNFLARVWVHTEEIVWLFFRGNVIKRDTIECEMRSFPLSLSSFPSKQWRYTAENCLPFSYDILFRLCTFEWQPSLRITISVAKDVGCPVREATLSFALFSSSFHSIGWKMEDLMKQIIWNWQVDMKEG